MSTEYLLLHLFFIAVSSYFSNNFENIVPVCFTDEKIEVQRGSRAPKIVV